MATVLKHDRKPSDGSTDRALRAATFTLSDMSSHGEEYVGVVRREAAKAVQEARAEADAIRKRAAAEGRAAGEAEVDQRLDQKIAEQMKLLRPALERAAGELTDTRGEWLAHWEQAALGVAKAMAIAIVRRELASDPQLSLAWVREALTLAANASEITLRLHPDDHTAMRGEAEKLAASIAKLAKTTVVSDPSISPGGCRVETLHGSVDMQIEKQAAQLVQELS